MGKSTKGSRFEREFCERLGLWWTQSLPEPRDDVFWRTSNSGGRATTRAQSGKKADIHCGDVCTTDAIGQPFLDVFTVELKRGYNSHTIAHLLDKPNQAAVQLYEEWLVKSEKVRVAANSLAWLLVVRRDRREALVFFPSLISLVFNGHSKEPGGWLASFSDYPHLQMSMHIEDLWFDVMGVTLEDFLVEVSPSRITKLSEIYKRSLAVPRR